MNRICQLRCLFLGLLAFVASATIANGQIKQEVSIVEGSEPGKPTLVRAKSLLDRTLRVSTAFAQDDLQLTLEPEPVEPPAPDTAAEPKLKSPILDSGLDKWQPDGDRDDNADAKASDTDDADESDDDDVQPRQRGSYDLKDISTDVRQIGIRFRTGEEVSPQDRSDELLSVMPHYVQPEFALKTFAWAAPDIRYQPLYFEDVPLERYGQTPGPVRAELRSGLHFFRSAALLPVLMWQDHPSECDYPLGFCRPGTAVPFTWQRQLDVRAR